MARKTGRPTNDPKDVLMPVRLSSTDAQKLEYCSEQTNSSKAEVIRIGIDKVYESIENSEAEEEMEEGRLSFEDVNGQNIPFENYKDLKPALQRDAVSGKITGHLIEYDDGTYLVNKRTYEFIKEKTNQ